MLTGDVGKQKISDAHTKQNNDRVLVWLLGSMEPTVRQQVEIMSTVPEVWKTLENQFAGKSNKMHANRILEELTHLKQGTKSVTEYAGEVKLLYRDLHHYHPFQPIDKQDLPIHHKWFESIVAKLFLDGLNKEFNLRRQLIFSQTEWSSLDDIISSVLEKETRLGQPKEDDLKSVDDRAALSMQHRRTPVSFGKIDKSKLFCDHFKRNGHRKDVCFELHGYPSWWEKGKTRSGGVQSVNRRQANHTTSLREPPVVDARALEEFNSKLKLSESLSSSQGTSKADSSLIATSHQGAKDWENLGDWDRA
ncbi:uncharacterized protein LOC112271996 isoform X2 [Brachypodium distachyon]|uniref:uncharacterized protein LOC112271996 isoform X2 n=1 Tax=Brachypodium distachyon TaxID=15368 RepID=UPI000D0DA91F|nr:uncharacterized protein LOC112271996 isoform X2 [Brachypodium distachyon]|eukprot:XP_024318149.1 uncharacterized protein LOC112271996 isoform X2 [Brachypodium distachyon]